VLAQYGSLAALGEGRIGPAVWLSTLPGGKSLVGLGSLSGLRGEILIVDGATWLGYPSGPSGAYGRELGPADETAAFLVTAAVPAWRRMSLAREVRFEALEASVAQLARDAGLDDEQPFPIVFEGTLRELEFSVVNGRGFETGKPRPRGPPSTRPKACWSVSTAPRPRVSSCTRTRACTSTCCSRKNARSGTWSTSIYQQG
jgi:hypothetical protein